MRSVLLSCVAAVVLSSCMNAESKPATKAEVPKATAPQAAAAPAAPKPPAAPVNKAASEGTEMPVWKIPNVPSAAEAYYAPDNLHVIAQTQDPQAKKNAMGRPGSLTYTFTDQGTDIRRINDTGQDACSYFFPDMKRLIWTSTKDNLDMPVGNWSDQSDYPQGGELYTSDLNGKNVNRMTQLGTFAEYMVVNEASVVKIDPNASLKAAALISCGISTGFGSAVDRAKVTPGETVVVVGCGGVGAGAIQGARLAGARQILAVDPLPFKTDKAKTIGATHTAASMLEANLMLPDMTQGRMADVVILTPGVLTGDLIAPAMALASKDGRVVTTAIAPFNQDKVDLNLFNFAMFNQALLGTVFGSCSPRVQIPNLLRLYEAGMLEIDDLITQEYTLDQVQNGYDDLASGLNIRGVVNFSA